MALENLVKFWTEIVQDSGTSCDFGGNSTTGSVFTECLETAENLRIWDGAKDESLKSILSIINRMLNESKTTIKGLTLLNSFVRHISPSRLVAVQDVLTSTLHLTVKNLDSELAQQILFNFLPQCHKLPDLNQLVTTTIVSKILSHFGEQSKFLTIPSINGLNLLRVCLQKYHGPCGNFRSNLEKILLPAIDQNCRASTTRLMLQTMPLLSASGGGGTKGDKHGLDWHNMVTKTLGAMNDCVVHLFGDACTVSEGENPYKMEGGPLSIPEIQDENVYNRLTSLKRRLLNLTNLLGYYLRDPFPAAKSCPQRGIMCIIWKMLLLNPVDILRNVGNIPRQEFIYLASILPSVHQAAFRLLNSLICCVGSNILPEAVRVEQLFLQELTWMFEKVNWLEDLKTEVYKAMLCWLNLTKSSVTSPKTVTSWIGFLRKDIEIEREVVELNLMSKSRKKGQPKLKVSSTLNISTSTRAGDIVTKNTIICQLALDLLTLLHPAAEPIAHQALYKQVGRIVAEFTQSTRFPSPYDDPVSRNNAFKLLLTMTMNPHHNSPISVSLLISLIQQGRNDPVPLVATFCTQASSLLERLAHPICPTMGFPNLSFAPTSDLPDDTEDLNLTTDSVQTSVVAAAAETAESFCQTDIEFEPTNVEFENGQDSTRNTSSAFEIEEIKDTITQTIQDSIDKYMFRRQLTRNVHLEEIESTVGILGSPSSNPSTSTISTNGFCSKRKPDTILESTATPEKSVPSKKAKIVESDYGDEYIEWLKDFVNVGPDN